MKSSLALLVFACALSAQTSNYPASLDTNASLFVAADNVQTTLANAVGLGDTAVFINTAGCGLSSCGFAANQLATVCDAVTTVTTGVSKCTAWETMLVTAVASNVLTVTRAQAGTSARTHIAGAVISVLIDSAHQSALKSGLIAVETLLGPNGSNLSSSPLVLASRFNFTPIVSGAGVTVSGGNLVIGNNTLTFTTVPPGVNGTDSGHYLYFSGGTGTAEGCLISGGSGTAGGTNGQIIVHCSNTHTGAWSVASGSGGIYEAIISLGATTGVFTATGTGGGTVWAAPGLYKVQGGPILLPSNVTLKCDNPESSILQSQGTSIVQTVPGSVRSSVVGCGFDFNAQNNIIGLDLQSVAGGTYRNLFFSGGAAGTGTLNIRLYSILGSALPCFGVNPTCGNTVQNYISDIHAEFGGAKCVQYLGACTVGTCASTLNTLNNMRCAAHGPLLIDFAAAADTNFLDNIDLASSTSTAGIVFNSGSPSNPSNGINAEYVRNLTCESTGTCLQFGAGYQIQVDNVWNLGATSFSYVQGQLTSTSITNLWSIDVPTGVAQISNFSTDGFVIGSTSPGLGSWIGFPRAVATLANGANHDINLENGSYDFISGPSAAFSVGGFAGGVDGRTLWLHNPTGQQMTITNADSGSQAANRINTQTGANVVLPAGPSDAFFQYESISSTWLLKGVWPTVTNAYNAAGTLLPNTHTVIGTCTLGTNCAVTLTGAAAFTSSSSYSCSVTDSTSAAAVKFAPSSGTAFTLTGTGTDVLPYVCTGN